MKNLLDRLVALAKNPVMRPVEVWALRAVVAFVAVQLGIDIKSLV